MPPVGIGLAGTPIGLGPLRLVLQDTLGRGRGLSSFGFDRLATNGDNRVSAVRGRGPRHPGGVRGRGTSGFVSRSDGSSGWPFIDAVWRCEVCRLCVRKRRANGKNPHSCCLSYRACTGQAACHCSEGWYDDQPKSAPPKPKINCSRMQGTCRWFVALQSELPFDYKHTAALCGEESLAGRSCWRCPRHYTDSQMLAPLERRLLQQTWPSRNQ